MRKWSTPLVIAALAVSLQSNGNQSAGNRQVPADSARVAGYDRKSPSDKGIIVIEVFQIVDGDSNEVLLQMDKDGKCYLNTSFIGTITAAGEVKSEEGDVVARLQGDQFMTSENKVLLMIKADGTISDGSGPEMSWDPDGFLTNSETGLKLVPADTKAKRAASILLSAFMGFGVTDSEQ